MLVQFSVENFKSFKNEVVLSLEASFDSEHDNNVSVIDGDKYLNSLVIFGGNATGKSNLFTALSTAISMIRNSNNKQIQDPINEIVPFKFDEDCIYRPSRFEFVFIERGKKYVYGFSSNKKEVINEYLYVYNSKKASLVFDRKNVNEYRFTSVNYRKELQPIIKRNSDNKLFLATATSWNCKSTKIPFIWFNNKINIYSNNYQLLDMMIEKYINDDELKTFTNNLLFQADMNVKDFNFEVMKDVDDKEYKINTIHIVKEHEVDKQYSLSLLEESQGTQNIFKFSPILKSAFENGETVCIDEFDTGLHPHLERYLFSLFNDKDINKFNAQLIVSTHSMVLMSLNELRRDQVYFVEKDNNTGVSELYSLDEFSPRKNKNIRKAYLLGRYGSIPNILGG